MKTTKVLVSWVLFIAFVYAASAFQCRYGRDNFIGYIHWNDNCKANQTACFQSLKCTKYGRSYRWTCFERNKCKNGTDGRLYGTFEGVRGVCCLTYRCNAYKLQNCTDPDPNAPKRIDNSGSSIQTRHVIGLVSGMLMTIIMMA